MVPRMIGPILHKRRTILLAHILNSIRTIITIVGTTMVILRDSIQDGIRRIDLVLVQPIRSLPVASGGK